MTSLDGRTRVRFTVTAAALLLAALGAAYADLPLGAPEGMRPADDSLTTIASSQYLALLPDGETKRRFILECTGCHQFDERMIGVEGRLKSEEEWRVRTEQMLSFSGAHTTFPILAPSRNAAQTANWMVESLGDEHHPIPQVEPFYLDSGEGPSFTEYPLPNQQDLPHDLVLDGKGHVVITGQLSGKMYTLDAASGRFSEYAIPVPNANPRALSVDEKGVWWVLLGGPEKIARYDPAEKSWAYWDIGMHPHSIVREASGRIWFNGHFTKNPELIGTLDPSTGFVETYEVPAPTMPDGGSTIPYGLRAAPDGTIWGTQLMGNRLVKFEPEEERFTLYELPSPYSGPRRLDIGSEGTVWIPEYAAGKLARFDPRTETFAEFDLPVKDALPYVVRVDSERGWIWIATAAADALLRFFVDEERFETYPLPSPKSLVRHMELDADSGTLWLSYGNFPTVTPKIVKVEP